MTNSSEKSAGRPIRKVLAEIARDIDPECPEEQGKTLIYAVDDPHTDMVVKILKEIYSDTGVDNYAIMKSQAALAAATRKRFRMPSGILRMSVFQVLPLCNRYCADFT